MTDRTHRSGQVEKVSCAVMTVSDTRTDETDESGALIRERLTSRGHVVTAHEIIHDDPDRIRAAVEAYCADTTIQAVLLTGGTGLAPRDTTYEAIAGRDFATAPPVAGLRTSTPLEAEMSLNRPPPSLR